MTLKFTPILSFLILLSVNLSAQKILEPYTPLEYFKEAVEFFQEEEYDEAFEAFEKIHPNDTLYPSALMLQVLSKRQEEKFADCVELCDKGVKINKDNVHLYYINKAIALNELKKHKEALEIVDEGLGRFPFNLELTSTRADIYKSQGKFEEALSILQQNVLNEPMNPDHHRYLAQFASNAHAYTQSLFPIVTAIALDPENEDNLNYLSFLSGLLDSGFKTKKPEVVIDGFKDPFSEVDELIESKVAMEKKYDVPSKIYYNFVRQLYLAITESDSKGDDFWTKHYLPLYKDIVKSGKFADLALLISYTIPDDKVSKQSKRSFDEVVSIFEHVQNTFEAMAEDKPSIMDLPHDKVKYFFRNDGTLATIGKYDKKKNIIIGEMVGINQAGSLDRRGSMDNNGDMTGKWEWYYPSGQLKERSIYVKDEAEGPSSYYSEDGVMLFSSNFKDGELNGKREKFKLIGHKFEEETYKDGKKEGKAVGYYADQSVSYEMTFKDDEPNGAYISYYDDGSIQRKATFKDGEYVGLAELFYRNGTLDYSTNYKDGEPNGSHKSVYMDGSIYEEGKYKMGKRVGKWAKYKNSGKLISESNYDENGKQNGDYKFYDHYGLLAQKSTYKNGDLTNIVNLDSKGNVTSTFKKKRGLLEFESTRTDGTTYCTGTFKDGERHGAWVYYDVYGNKTSESNYKEGNLDGEYISYNANDELANKYNYKEDEKDGLYVSYFSNGRMSSQGYYRNGELEGRYVSYSLDGTIVQDLYYSGGVLDGVNKYFDNDGRIYLEQVYDLGFLKESIRYDGKGEQASHLKLVNGKGSDEYAFFEGGPTMGKNSYIGGVSNGPIIRYFPNGKVRLEANYVNDEIDGKRTTYYHTGQVRSSRHYDHGDRVGEWIDYFENGQERLKRTYEHGKLTGKYTFYHENGQISNESEYVFGESHGEEKLYSESGELQIVRYYENDVLLAYAYPDKDGKLVDKIPIKEGTAKIVSYYPNGKKSREYNQVRGLFDGPYIVYYDDGQISDKVVYKNGDRDGDRQDYYKDGTLKSEQKYKIGYKDGEQKYYHPNGKLMRVENWLMDEEQGIWTYYDESGNKTQEIIYQGGVLREIR